jgi:hypothetical protein
MNKIISCLVKNYIEDKWLELKMEQLSRSSQQHFILNRYPTYTLENFNQLNNFIHDTELLYVSSIGDIIVDQDTLWKKLHSIPDNVGLIGHIIWYPDQPNPHLHEQCFIIRTAALSGFIDFYKKSDTGLTFVRSQEDMHDGHAPLWIDLSKEISNRKDNFGTFLMEQILKSGYKVVNFDESWRYPSKSRLSKPKEFKDNYIIPTRGYLYPNYNSNVFSRCLKNIELNDLLEPAQTEAILVIKEFLKFNIINVYHYDKTEINFPAEQIISLGNGLMGECLAFFNNAKKIIFYYINTNNIEFKKYMYDNFDGADYEKFYIDYANERNLKIEPFDMQEIEASEEELEYSKIILKNWNCVKKIEKEYLNDNLFNILDILLSKIDRKTIFYTSTILEEYFLTHLLYNLDEINAVIDNIEKKMLETDSLWLRHTPTQYLLK